MTTEKIYWQRPGGGTIDLTDKIKFDILQNVDGRYMPGFDFIADDVYTYPGQVLRAIKTKPREVSLPIVVFGTDIADLRANLRFLTAAFSPRATSGNGKLRVVTEDNKTFLLNCYFQGGMTMPESYDTGDDRTFRIFDTTFIAHDPFWYDPIETELQFWDPYAGLSGNKVIYNHGDVDTWPIWSIWGPMVWVHIYHEATNEYITITKTLTNANHVVYVDTRPLHRTVMLDHQTSTFASLHEGSALFPLVPGANIINIELGQTTYNATGGVSCRFIERYLGV